MFFYELNNGNFCERWDVRCTKIHFRDYRNFLIILTVRIFLCLLWKKQKKTKKDLFFFFQVVCCLFCVLQAKIAVRVFVATWKSMMETSQSALLIVLSEQFRNNRSAHARLVEHMAIWQIVYLQINGYFSTCFTADVLFGNYPYFLYRLSVIG